MTSESAVWTEANQRYLSAATALVRASLEPEEEREVSVEAAGDRLAAAARAMPAPSTVEHVCSAFRLSDFERDVLLLCAGVELDAGLAERVAALGGAGDPRPTFGLALACLREPHWSALSPEAPLRSWRLVEVGTGRTLTGSPLRLDERLLHFLAGVECADDRLTALTEPLRGSPCVIASHQQLADEMSEVLERAWQRGEHPAVELVGEDPGAKRAVAAEVCRASGIQASLIPSPNVPTRSDELTGFARLWNREARLTGAALYIDAGELETGDTACDRAVGRLVDLLDGMVFVAGRERRCPSQRALLGFSVSKATVVEQRDWWHGLFEVSGIEVDGHLDDVVSQYRLDLDSLRSAGSEVAGEIDELARNPEAIGRRVWQVCRRQARPRLGRLAQLVPPLARWEELVLPPEQHRILREIAVQVRQRSQVYERWGFARKSARGLGITALFCGVSGTGKTMAAEVLADDLDLDLYRIDLSTVVSKYIGETEKNLRALFDGAEDSGAVLLFDEADAFYGKRSEVKDSHDRYANIEISYLLQKMEAYRGLAILTTNMKSALDPAFFRRLRFVVEFPFPGAEERAEIWRRIFPAEIPTEGLEVGKLACLNVAGGNIRNIALGAAFAAAEAETPVRMRHLLAAAKREFRKLEKPWNESEVRNWLA